MERNILRTTHSWPSMRLILILLPVSCNELTEMVNKYHEHNLELITNIEKLTQANKILKENEKIYESKLEALHIEKQDLKVKILNQQSAIDSYLTEISLQQKEYAEAQSEIFDYKRKLSNLLTSSMIFDQILHAQRTDTKGKSGIGYKSIPPPKDYTPMPDQDEIKNFVPTTPLVVDPVLVDPLVRNTDPDDPISIEKEFDESVVKVEKSGVNPENFIITTEDEETAKKGKFKLETDNKILNTESKSKTKKQSLKSKSPKESHKTVRILKK